MTAISGFGIRVIKWECVIIYLELCNYVYVSIEGQVTRRNRISVGLCTRISTKLERLKWNDLVL